MLCEKCGTLLPEDARFCGRCGHVIPSPQAMYQQSTYQAAPQPMHYSQAQTVLDVDQPSVSALKKLLRSPVMITSIVVMFLIVLAYGFLLVTFSAAMLAYSGKIPVMILWCCWLLLLMLSVALTVVAGCASARKGCSRAGVIMLRVVNDIFLGVYSLITLVAALALVLIFVRNPAYCEMIWRMSPHLLIVEAVMVLMLIGTVIFLIRMDSLCSAMSQIIKTGKTGKRASVYAAIFALLCAAAILFVSGEGIYEMFTENIHITRGDIGIMLMIVLPGVAFLTWGILILSYRSKVQPLAEIPKPIPTGKAPAQQQITE